MYPFFKYDYMTKRSLRGYASRRTVRCGDLQERLSASKVREGAKAFDRYQAYGTEVPRSIPGSLQHWWAVGLDLTAMVTHRGLPQFFACWSQTQSTLSQGWGSHV